MKLVLIIIRYVWWGIGILVNEVFVLNFLEIPLSEKVRVTCMSIMLSKAMRKYTAAREWSMVISV